MLDKDERAYFEARGLHNDPKVIKIFNKLAGMLGEEAIGRSGVATSLGARTPDQAQIEINAILTNGTHPYHNRSHPNHKAALAEGGVRTHARCPTDRVSGEYGSWEGRSARLGAILCHLGPSERREAVPESPPAPDSPYSTSHGLG